MRILATSFYVLHLVVPINMKMQTSNKQLRFRKQKDHSTKKDLRQA